jgi:deoxyribodipyrimidine photolyase-related protein
VRGLYWLKMPDYVWGNSLEAERPLPEFYWSAATKMNCLRQCVVETKENAHAHHIQRLMVLGNFALLAGLNRMSDYCKGCSYKVSKKNGADACPFNYLYSDFLIRQQDKLGANPRMGMAYRTLGKMDAAKVDLICADSTRFLYALDAGEIV